MQPEQIKHDQESWQNISGVRKKLREESTEDVTKCFICSLKNVIILNPWCDPGTRRWWWQQWSQAPSLRPLLLGPAAVYVDWSETHMTHGGYTADFIYAEVPRCTKAVQCEATQRDEKEQTVPKTKHSHCPFTRGKPTPSTLTQMSKKWDRSPVLHSWSLPKHIRGGMVIKY